MRGMTVSRATTAVTTAGNSNGFHLESTHSSIRPRNRKKEVEEKARERQKTIQLGGSNKRQYVCSYILVSFSGHEMSNYTSNTNSKKGATLNAQSDLKRIVVTKWNSENCHFLHNMKLLWTMLKCF